MPTTNCLVCANEFYIKPNRLLKGWGKYCSKKCNYQGQKTGSMFACHTCGKTIYKNVAQLGRPKSGNYFCGKSCQTIWRNSELFIRENHINWKGGESSYREFMKRTSKDVRCSKCQTKDSRVLAVHHKDRNRQNNSGANLIWLCHNCHHLVHHYNDEAKGYLTA